jgi:glucose/arabinose dehydrogenase
MTFLPDGNALVVERQKGVDLLDVKFGKLTPLDGGPEVLVGTDTGVHDSNRPATLTGEDAGFHDIILHPDYAKNGWIYLSYSEGPRERSTTSVDRFRLRDNKLVDRQRIFTANAYSEDRFHYGGRMAFIGGYLYLTVGDRHHQDRAQQLDTHAGKILRLRDDGSTPPDNPFIGTKDAKPEIWTFGHRNPQGLVVNPETGDLWEHEHSPLHGDELNIIHRGANLRLARDLLRMAIFRGPNRQGHHHRKRDGAAALGLDSIDRSQRNHLLYGQHISAVARQYFRRRHGPPQSNSISDSGWPGSS